MFYLRHFWPLTSYQPGIQFLAILFISQSARAPFEIRQTSQDEECFNYFYHGLSCQVDTFTPSCILFSTQARKLQKSEKGSERMCFSAFLWRHQCSFDANPPWLLTQFVRFWYFMAASGAPRRVANESKTPSKEKVPDMWSPGPVWRLKKAKWGQD